MRLFWQLMILRAPEDGSGGASAGADSGGAAPSGDTGGSASASADPSPAAGGSEPSPAPAPASDDIFEFPSDVIDDGLAAEEVESIAPTPAPAPPSQDPAPAPAAAAPQVTEPQAPSAPTGTTPPSLTPADPMAIARVMRENEPALVEHLAQTEFALSPEDIQGLEEDAVAYTPKLLARTYVRMQQNMMAQLARVVPAMLTAHQEVSKRSEKSENAFFERWPGLKKEEFLPEVRRAAQMYRRMNPQASREEMIDELGQILSIKLKVPLTGVPTPRPAVPNGQPRAVQTTPPFRPAMGGPAAVPTPQEADPWAGLGQDFEG